MAQGFTRRMALALVLTAAAAACGPTPTTPTKDVPYSQIDLRLGTGADVASGATVTANYTGWLYDGSKTDFKGLQFDTSTGRAPLTFTLGAGQVISGLERGMIGMKAGGARRMVIPPSLGYGIERNGPIPPFSTLVFEVELLSVQ